MFSIYCFFAMSQNIEKHPKYLELKRKYNSLEAKLDALTYTPEKESVGFTKGLTRFFGFNKNLPDIVLDREGYIIEATGKIIKKLGYESDKLIDKNFGTFFKEDHYAKFSNSLKTSLENDEIIGFEFCAKLKSSEDVSSDYGLSFEVQRDKKKTIRRISSNLMSIKDPSEFDYEDYTGLKNEEGFLLVGKVLYKIDKRDGEKSK